MKRKLDMAGADRARSLDFLPLDIGGRYG